MYAQRTSMMMKSAGMHILLNRSTPFWTPIAMTAHIIAAKMRKKMTDCFGFVMKSVKYLAENVTIFSPDSTRLSLLKSLTGCEIIVKRYFVTHPPMTQ